MMSTAPSARRAATAAFGAVDLADVMHQHDSSPASVSMFSGVMVPLTGGIVLTLQGAKPAIVSKMTT